MTMYGINDFHESYYDHHCLIIPQKDVLHMDIVGSGIMVSLRRWWHDLFLLTSSDRRVWVHFTSSRNLHMERVKQFRQYRHRIHPMSKFRNFWDCLMLHVFILHKIVFHHNTSVLFGKVFHVLFYYIALAFEAIIIVDIFVNFKTGFIDNRNKRVVLDLKTGVLNYCSTKLFIHCFSAMPLQWIMFLRFKEDIECALCKTNYFVCVLRILEFTKPANTGRDREGLQERCISTSFYALVY